MYLYFDARGDLKEIVNDEPIRQGSSDNKVYCYFEGLESMDGVWCIVKKADGTLTTETDIIGNEVRKEIPYNKKRDMKFFKDYQTYRFFYYDLTQDITNQSGLMYFQVRCTVNNEQVAYGLATFNVATGVIQSTSTITQSQYDYLLEQVNMRKIWIRYADDENGTNMTTEYNYQIWMGIFIGGVASNNPSDYTWLRFSVSVDDSEDLSNLSPTSPIDEALNLYQAYLIKQLIDNHKADTSNPHNVNSTQVGLGRVQNYGVVTVPSESAVEEYITGKGVFDYLRAYYAELNDFTELTTQFNALCEILSLVWDEENETFGLGTDLDAIVNNLADLIRVFQNFPESDNLAQVLTALDSRVDVLEHTRNNGFVVLDRANNTDLLTLTPNRFTEQSTPEYEEYPWVATISADEFVGAIKVSVIYDVPNASSDILSSGIKLDNVSGQITIYAMEQPSENVIIQEIDIINCVAVYQLYSHNVVNQVNTNTNKIGILENAVTDITGTLLPRKVDKQATFENDAKINVRETNAGGTGAFYIITEDYSESAKFGGLAIMKTIAQLYAGTKSGNNTYASYLQVFGTSIQVETPSFYRVINREIYDIPYINNQSTSIDEMKETYSRNKIDSLTTTGFYDLITDTLTIGTDLTTSFSNLSNLGSNRPKVGDLVIDANNVLGRITNRSMSNETVTITPLRSLKEARTYKHSITMQRTDAKPMGVITLVIENNSADAINTGTKLYNALIAKGYGDATAGATIPTYGVDAKTTMASGIFLMNTGAGMAYSIGAYDGSVVIYGATIENSNAVNRRSAIVSITDLDASWTISDNNPV